MATSVVAVLQDVTDRLGTIAELSRSEARLGESERLVGVGSWEMTLETGEITYSQGFARLLGLAPGERLDSAGFVQMVHSEDRETLVRRQRQVSEDWLDAVRAATGLLETGRCAGRGPCRDRQSGRRSP